MNGPERADFHVAQISTLLDSSVIVTADPLDIPPGLSANRPVVAVQPPALSFPTYHATDAEWEVFVIAGPYTDQRRAWETIAGIIEALEGPLSLETAKPASFSAPSMPEYPAYVLTFSETL